MKSPKMPKAPSAQQMAESEARYGQVGQVTPWGSVTYEGDVGSPERRQVISLSPQQQQLMGIVGQRISGLEGQMAPLTRDFSQEAQDLERRTYEAGLKRLQPQMEQQQRQMETTLANRGIPIGSEAYNRAMQQMGQSQADILSGLATQSIGAGRAEQERLARLGMAQRGQVLGELGSLQGFIREPQPAVGPGISGMPEMLRAQYQQQIQAAQQKAQQRGGLLGALGSIGGTIMGGPIGGAIGNRVAGWIGG